MNSTQITPKSLYAQYKSLEFSALNSLFQGEDWRSWKLTYLLQRAREVPRPTSRRAKLERAIDQLGQAASLRQTMLTHFPYPEPEQQTRHQWFAKTLGDIVEALVRPDPSGVNYKQPEGPGDTAIEPEPEHRLVEEPDASEAELVARPMTTHQVQKQCDSSTLDMEGFREFLDLVKSMLDKLQGFWDDSVAGWEIVLASIGKWLIFKNCPLRAG